LDVKASLLFSGALVALSLVTSVHTARGQTPTEGERLFLEGRQLLEQGKVDEACAAFQASYEAEHALGSLLNLANCEEQRKKFRAALARWREAAANADTEKNRLYSVGRAADLEAKMPKILVRLGPGAGRAVVTIDGEPTSAGEKIAVDPGEHIVVATLTDDASGVLPPKTERQTITSESGKTQEVLLLKDVPAPKPVVQPVVQPAPVPSTDWSIPGWISLGIGGAGAVVFAATGAAILNECGADLGGKSFVCVDDAGEPTEKPTGLVVANLAGMIVGALGVGLGVTFLIVEATEEDAPSVTVTGIAVPGGGGLGLSGAF
jgi:hypothetical protein